LKASIEGSLKTEEKMPSTHTQSDPNLIFARGVRKSFGQFEALKNFDFAVTRGQCVGLLGPNGAGKSTFIGMVYGVVLRSGGELSVFGLDPTHSARAIKQRLGIVTQENALDESLSVSENIRLYAAFEGLSKKDADSRMNELLEYMNLAHKRDATIQSLSGGMKRRLVFVRALLSRPELLILDEPTTGLDPAVRLLLWNKVRELRASGTTILLTTHYMHEAEALCDNVVIVNEGLEIAEGSPRALVEQHVPGFVGQFNITAEQELFRSLNGVVESMPGLTMWHDSYGVTIRAPALETLIDVGQKIGTPPTQLRPANLEDVFLKLAGNTLAADA
jgi:lipooligosaccharide transport system ATP-binding protein